MAKELNRSRAALLPTPGDPFILSFFLKNFREVWADEVDKLYVCLNVDKRVSNNIVDYDMVLLDTTPKVEYLCIDEMVQHGEALKALLPAVEEDNLFLIEDDTIIFKKGQVDKYFRKLESKEVDVIGSPRFSCSKGILDASAEKYNLDYSGYGDNGPNYWPCFFFIAKENLLKTDLHLGAKTWLKGSYIKELDLTVEDIETGDSFVWLSMQLRAMGLKFYDIQQYHSSPTDMLDMVKGKGIGDINCGWIHIGSLSSTIEEFILDGDPDNYGAKPSTRNDKAEIERRYAWVKLILNNYDYNVFLSSDIDPLLGEKYLYEKKMNNYIRSFDLSVKNIEDLYTAYGRYIRW